MIYLAASFVPGVPVGKRGIGCDHSLRPHLLLAGLRLVLFQRPVAPIRSR
jgi:hypothetical protein